MEAGRHRSDWLDDVSPADWIADRLHPFVQDTGSVIPADFDAYARIFHPVGESGRWADLARSNGRIAHAQMQLHLISAPPGEQAELYRSDASWGSLPIAPRRALTDLLAPRTTTPGRCWLAWWEGFGGLDDGGVDARVELPSRRYLLASGPIEAAIPPLPTTIGIAFDQSPNLWWPDDRAWFVATEIDYAWTYVGGTRATIDAVLADARLEALEAQITDLPFHDADVVNAALDP